MMLGIIQTILLIAALSVLLIYVLFFRSLVKSQLNLWTKVLWLVVAMTIPVLGVLIYFVLKDNFKLMPLNS